MIEYTSDEILELRNKIIVEAKKLVGIPFSHSGITHSALDCKGCCWLAYLKAGLNYIPSSDGKTYSADWYLFADENRYLEGLLKYFNFTNNPSIGDIVMFATSKRKEIWNHAGILIGNKKFIHARSGHKVSSDSLENPHWKKRFKGYLILKEFDIKIYE